MWGSLSAHTLLAFREWNAQDCNLSAKKLRLMRLKGDEKIVEILTRCRCLWSSGDGAQKLSCY